MARTAAASTAAAQPRVSRDPASFRGKGVRGLTFERRWTRPGVHPYDEVTWDLRSAEIKSESGKTVFEQHDIEVPNFWSQLATNVVVSKYFRGHIGTPGRERSVKQLIDRVVNTITAWAATQHYFHTTEDLEAFRAELTHLLLHQKMAFNSPVWFNVGVEPRPQCSACQPYRALVSTPEGMVPIGRLVDEAAIGREVYDASGVTRIVAVKANGRKPVRRVVLRNGNFIEATPDHVVRAVRARRAVAEWLPVDQLEPGMRLHLHPHRAKVGQRVMVAAGVSAGSAIETGEATLPDAIRLDDDQTTVLRAEAALAGWLQADGFVGQYDHGTNRSLTIEFQVASDDEYQWVMDNLDVALPHVHRKTREADTKRTRVRRIRLYGESLREFVERWELLPRGTAIRVPSRLWAASLDEICAYLRSVFQADGYVSVRRGNDESARIGFAVIGERWTEDVQLLLNTVGIYSRRLHKREMRDDRRDLHEVSVSIGSERARFAELIGFVGRDKQARLVESLGLRGLKACPNLREEEIVAIEDLGVEEVYDIQTESGEYLSNNVAVHNCFINSVEDTMSSIMDLAKTEAMLFKYGSGAGVNLSTIRGSKEKMAGGGIASGPVSFMKGYDSFAGVIKSGGKTRRAAKMVILDADHPDVMEFITSKAHEEKKAWALIEAGYDPSFTGEAYGSVFFQNANHSVRVTDEFMRAVETDATWTTRAVTTGEPVDTYRARDLFKAMADAAHLCGDPGIQYDTIINDWHTCANTDRIYASNPCSEYMFLNDTACFAPETRISTPNGLRTVEDLFLAQERGAKVLVTTDLSGEHDHRRLTAHRPALVTLVGERPVYRMKLRDGRSIRTTGDHRFLTDAGEWKRVDELRSGEDRVAIRESGNPVRFESSDAEVRRWQMLGWLTGDGVFSKDTAALVFGPQERDTAESMAEEFRALVAEARAQEAAVESVELDLSRGALLTEAGVATPFRGRGHHLSTQTNGVMQIASGSGAVVRLLEDRYGFKQGTATVKDVPSEIHHVNDDLKIAYLQGLFSSDGSIFSQKWATEDQAMLASSSPALLRSVQLLLADLGITSRISWAHPAGRKNPQGQLHIFNQQARTFLTLVGFPCSTSKSARAAQILGRAFAGARKNPRPAAITSIEPDGATTVYDITEPVTHSVIAEGLIAHNCNLASVNLMKFVKDDGEFDIEAYRYACKVTITAQEILVDNASYPTPRIEENSHKYRPLGLGYANLGALLMSRGLAYDSDQGRAYAATLTAIMTGEAYRQSAEIARDHGGPFMEYPLNEQPMLRVIGKHRDAAYAIPEGRAPSDLIAASRATWDEALELGRQHGFRNAQSSVLAPTGTISFMLDCDTTGIEPDIALIKYKKLVGEGFLKIVNQTVPGALKKLGYSPAQVEEIVEYVNDRETIEGAPGLRTSDLSVFDCAFKPVNGERSIHYMGHVRMMAAVQPFLSGAISKTVNMPEAATPDEIERVYLEGWKLGLKAIAIYRDGSKRSQPLSTGKKKDGEVVDSAEVEELKKQLTAAMAEAKKPHRRRLPAERAAVTHKFEIAGHEGYITVGLYPDGQPGEIFLKMAKEGSTVSGLMDTLATMMSVALQYGVPLRDLVNKFSHVRFEPAGFTGNAEIPIAKSIVDYIFRWLGARFLPKDERDALGIIAREPEVVPEVPAGPSAAAPVPETPVAEVEAPRPTLPVVESNGNGHAANGNGKAKETGSGTMPLSFGGTTKVAFSISADSPSCADCGSIMVRNGSCYKCLNCGSTSGCS